MNILLFVVIYFCIILFNNASEYVRVCKDRNNMLESNSSRAEERWGADAHFKQAIWNSQLMLRNSTISQYTNTVLVSFVNTYHKNIINVYETFVAHIAKSISEETSAASLKTQQIRNELYMLADELQVSESCDEEHRTVRTLATQHAAMVYYCCKEARTSVVKMGKYLDEMLGHIRVNMNEAIKNATKDLVNYSEPVKLKGLSMVAVGVGYEFDETLTQVRRYAVTCQQKFNVCVSNALSSTTASVDAMRDRINYCVYA